MSTHHVGRGAALMATLMLGIVGVAPSATADVDYSINGVYIATSIGTWAQTNHQYRDEASVISRWTITSTCQDPYTCSGTVVSDAGWTAEIINKSTEWSVRRDLPNWQPCPDGTFAPGKQKYSFMPVGPTGLVDPASPIFVGTDHTISPSGSCGKNLALVIEMPFRLDPAT